MHALQEGGTAAKLLGMKCVEKAVDYIRDDAPASPELLTMLLTNVTTTEAGSCSLLQIGRGDLEGFHMSTPPPFSPAPNINCTLSALICQPVRACVGILHRTVLICHCCPTCIPQRRGMLFKRHGFCRLIRY